ncbi:hypothetical protein GCM10023081_07040 [Arthrobacter ginkgonis]|uniref:Uncharacterized protein n=1 Tax=Arthrobacter ginkgonis TaxID=1630594 RepID=A0ABP7C051_9MICC
MVGQRQDVEPGGLGRGDDVGRGLGTVRDMRVGVEVDPHCLSLVALVRSWADPALRAARRGQRFPAAAGGLGNPLPASRAPLRTSCRGEHLWEPIDPPAASARMEG